MIGAGTVINPIIKIVTTVVILAAIGIFIVKPVLDTTEKAIDEAGRQVNASQQASQRAGDEFDLEFARSRAESFSQSLLVQTVHSDRSFALSYADSLAAQGDGAGASRVERCVKGAGFKPAAMERCRDLADDLLFG